MIWLIFFLSRYCRLGNEKTYLSAVLVWEFFFSIKTFIECNFELWGNFCFWRIDHVSYNLLVYQQLIFYVVKTNYYVKSVCIRSFRGRYLPSFGLNRERYFSVFRANAGKYGPKKLGIWTLFKKLTGFSIYVLHPACTLNHLCELWR